VSPLTFTLVTLILLGTSIAAVANFPAPFIWVYLLWCTTLTVCYIAAEAVNLRAFIVNLACFFVLLSGLEAYGLIKETLESEKHTYSGDYSTANEVLGYAPHKNISVKSRKTYNRDLLYEVTYTIDKNGLRIGPPIFSDQCILFFGGSFTFGAGVDDDQTMPWLAGELLNKRTLNFGFHGYGPHQMLARIESEEFDDIVDCHPVAAIYLMIANHLDRSAGRSPWDSDGPRYILNSLDEPTYTGTFRDHWSAFRQKYEGAKQFLKKSAAFRRFIGDRWFSFGEPLDEDAELLAGIVAASEKHLKAAYPDIDFFVLSWDGWAKERDALMHEKIRARNIELHLLSKTIPELRKMGARSTIQIPHDGHPTAAGQRKIMQAAIDLIRQKQKD